MINYWSNSKKKIQGYKMLYFEQKPQYFTWINWRFDHKTCTLPIHSFWWEIGTQSYVAKPSEIMIPTYCYIQLGFQEWLKKPRISMNSMANQPKINISAIYWFNSTAIYGPYLWGAMEAKETVNLSTSPEILNPAPVKLSEHGFITS